MWRAEVDEFAGRQNHFDGEHVVGSKAVFEAVRPAGVFRYIAANGAHRLGRGIRGVEVACRSHSLGDVRIDDARLYGDPLVGHVDGQDLRHAGKADHDASHIGHRSA